MHRPDPLEEKLAEALTRAGLEFVRDKGGANKSGLDFLLPRIGIEIEVKQFHSDRIAEQMARAPNVIAVQGEASVRFLCDLLTGTAQPGRDVFNEHEALHTASIASDFFNRHLAEQRAVEANPKLRAAADHISTALWEFYQMCGAEFLSESSGSRLPPDDPTPERQKGE